MHYLLLELFPVLTLANKELCSTQKTKPIKHISLATFSTKENVFEQPSLPKDHYHFELRTTNKTESDIWAWIKEFPRETDFFTICYNLTFNVGSTEIHTFFESWFRVWIEQYVFSLIFHVAEFLSSQKQTAFMTNCTNCRLAFLFLDRSKFI